MSEKAGLEVVATMDVTGVKKGAAEAKRELASIASAAVTAGTTVGASTSKLTASIGSIKNLGTSAFSQLKSGIGSIIGPTALMTAGIGAAVGAAVALGSALFKIISKDFTGGIDKIAEAHKKAAEAAKEYAKQVDAAVDSTGKEASNVFSLISVLKSETETRERKLGAIKELQKIQPEIFNGLNLEKNVVVGLDEAYKAYLGNLKNVIQAKILQAEIETKITRVLALQRALGVSNEVTDLKKVGTLKQLTQIQFDAAKAAKQLADNSLLIGLNIKRSAAIDEVSSLKDRIDELGKSLQAVSGSIKVTGIKDPVVKVPVVKVPKVKLNVEKFELDPKSTLLPQFTQGIPTLTLPALKIVDKGNPIIFDPAIAENVLKGLARAIKEANLDSLTDEFNKRITQSIQTISEDALVSAADAIGNALAGGKDLLPNLFGGLMRSVGDQIQQLGKFLITSSITIAAAKKAFKTLLANPVAAAIVGIGLVALGALLKAEGSKRFQGFATGTTNAPGGMALVGERGPELIGLPRGSSVLPNAQTNNLMAGGGVFIAENIIRGNDLVTVYNRATATNRRNG